MGRIADVLGELSKLGAVGEAKASPAPVRVPAPAPAREEPVDAPEADEDVEASIAALTEGFRGEDAAEDEAPEEAPEENSEPDAPAEAESEYDPDDIADLVVLAAQKLEEIEEATDQLKRLLRQMQER